MDMLLEVFLLILPSLVAGNVESVELFVDFFSRGHLRLVGFPGWFEPTTQRRAQGRREVSACGQ